MRVLKTAAEVRRVLGRGRTKARVGLAPTMGALHEGHAALFAAARSECDQVVATIFVNPTQFNDPADLAAYPRQEERDAELAAREGVDVLFVPEVTEIYPDGHATTVHVAGAAQDFEGAHRPGHFDGVATVCVKLFSIVDPDVSYFGQKDAQQVAVIRQVIRDLNLQLDLTVVPTVREADGLAMSSRNARLSASEKTQALAIPRALRAGLAAHQQGGDPVAAARPLLSGLDVDYLDIARFDGGPTLVVAARAGATRLIDNVPLDRPHLAGL